MKHNCDAESRTLTLTFPGDLISTNTDATRQEITSLMESPQVKGFNWQVLHLDLRAARMIDSVGLNLIVSLLKTAKGRNAKVTSQISSPNVQRSFIFTRLNTQMDIDLAA